MFSAPHLVKADPIKEHIPHEGVGDMPTGFEPPC
jgi:hypothetical protein